MLAVFFTYKSRAFSACLCRRCQSEGAPLTAPCQSFGVRCVAKVPLQRATFLLQCWPMQLLVHNLKCDHLQACQEPTACTRNSA